MIKLLCKFVLPVLLFLLPLYGCNRDKGHLYFSSRPITKQTFSYENLEKVFKVGERVNFLVIHPEEFKNSLIRIQIIKVSDKVNQYGYSLAHARDIEIETGSKYFIDDFFLYKDGYYIMRVFSHDDMNHPIVETDFWIKPL